MVVDFSVLDFKERPLLVLKNLDGTYIQPLTYAFDVHAKLMYNEVSEITFELPAYVDGAQTPHYDDVVGMRLIDWVGIGQFILVNPSKKSDGISEIKSCTAYSLEYEMTYKKIFLEEGTYNFWNPLAQEDTIIGRILEVMPSWSVGEIDSALWGKYRTLESDNSSVYDFIKNTLQDTYQCVFDFDTYRRTINVIAVSSMVATKQVYISHENLAKEIVIEEDTENIFTCLDVNGADEVDIRSVNPMGTNKIYNLDYFMGPSYFPQDFIDRWNSWKATYQSYQKPYFNLTVEKVLQESRLEVERADLTALQGELSALETLQSTYVDASAQGLDMSVELKSVKSDIVSKQAKITSKEALIEDIIDGIDAMFDQQQEINTKCNFKTATKDDGTRLFTDEEIDLLDRYIKEDSIAEDSFVYKTVSSYADSDVSQSSVNASAAFSDGFVSRTDLASGKVLYQVTNGSISLSMSGKFLEAKVVRANLEHARDNGVVMSVLLNGGTYDGVSFQSGCVSLIGTLSDLNSDVAADQDIGDSYLEGTSLTIDVTSANVYFTQNATEYEKRSVEWDLFEYGQECLDELAWPAYSFKVDSANFLAADEFALFKNQLTLGSKIYLNLGDDKVLSPITIGVEFSCDDPEDFTLLFGDKYSAKDSAFQLVDLLEQSISMGQTVASNKTNYNSFIESGASTQIKDYMDSALNAAKQAVLAGSNQEIQIDGSGIRLRKMLAGGDGYDPTQIWMTSGNIVFTRDNWDSAYMAIGTYNDPNFGTTSGIIAPSIVGTLLAGQNMLIESSKKDGDIAVFRVDADGARLYNSRFDLVNEYGSNQSGQITMMPPIGLVGGNATSTSPLFSYDENGDVSGVRTSSGNTMADLTSLSKSDLPNANFWLDMKGNAYFKGTVYATDGEFSGTVHATDGDFSGKIKAATLEGTLIGANGGEIKGVSLGIGGSNYDNFVVDSNGNVTMKGSINLSNGSITWGDNLPDTGISESEAINLIDQYGYTPPRYIKSTYISNAVIKSPIIKGNNMEVYGAYKVVRGSGSTMGYMGAAYGQDAYGNTTSGVAIASGYTTGTMTDGEGDGDTTITYASDGNYVIATSGGCRMQASKNSIVVTSNGAYLKFITPSGNTTYQIGVSADGCRYYDGSSWKSIGSGGGTVTAKWG